MKGEPEHLRQTAGLLLKNNVKELYTTMPPADTQHIQNELLVNIGDPSQAVRGTIGTVITTIVSKMQNVRPPDPTQVCRVLATLHVRWLSVCAAD